MKRRSHFRVAASAHPFSFVVTMELVEKGVDTQLRQISITLREAPPRRPPPPCRPGPGPAADAGCPPRKGHSACTDILFSAPILPEEPEAL